MNRSIFYYDYLFGLIGYPLSHSFSKKYFSQLFLDQGLDDYFYELFPLENIEAFPALLGKHPNLRGLNVTLPYKRAVMPYLDEVDPAAAAIGAVNTIHFEDGKTKGYNTDVYGFEISLQNLLNKNSEVPNIQALVFGTGGASDAVGYVLNKLSIPYKLVSRRVGQDRLSYAELTEPMIQQHRLLVNTTPLGMYPKAEGLPPIPYDAIGADHFLFDLVYNPEMTRFMQAGLDRKAQVSNGLEMLHLQAEKAWAIWNK